MVKILKLLFLFLIFSTLPAIASEYDGYWTGSTPEYCRSFDEGKRDIVINIKNGKTKVSWPSTNGGRVQYFGKVYKTFGSKKNKLGLNSSQSRIEGNFISKNKLIFYEGTGCEFVLLKTNSSTENYFYTMSYYVDNIKKNEIKFLETKFSNYNLKIVDPYNGSYYSLNFNINSPNKEAADKKSIEIWKEITKIYEKTFLANEFDEYFSECINLEKRLYQKVVGRKCPSSWLKTSPEIVKELYDNNAVRRTFQKFGPDICMTTSYTCKELSLTNLDYTLADFKNIQLASGNVDKQVLHCKAEGMVKTGENFPSYRGLDLKRINHNDEFSKCSDIPKYKDKQEYVRIQANEFCEKYFEGTIKNDATKILVLTSYPECILAGYPFKKDEFTEKQLVKYNLINVEDKTVAQNQNLEVKVTNNDVEVKTVKILNDYQLKDHFFGNRDTDFFVKKNEIYKLINKKENFALITNTNDWRKKGSKEGWISLKNIEILDKNYVFNNSYNNSLINNKKITNNKKLKISKNNYISTYCKDRNSNVLLFNEKIRGSSEKNKCGNWMVEISKNQYKQLRNNNFKKSNGKVVANNINTVEKKQKENVNSVKQQSIQVVEDNSAPLIIIDNKFVANKNFTASIIGTVEDKSEIALITVDGFEVSLANGKFSKDLFVKPGGKDIEIVSFDVHGNKSSKIVRIERQNIAFESNTFEFLDPRKLIIDKNINAAALIIGVESYENTFAAPFASNDALMFSDFAQMSLGVPRNKIEILTNEDADQNNTLKTVIKWLPKVIKEDETDLYVFFSGHGLASPDGEDLFLLPFDGDPEILEFSALMRNELFNQISKLNPRSVTVFLDTCYSGATRSNEMLIASAKPIFIEAQEQNIPSNFTVFSASSNNEIATVLEEAEHGLFSYFMMKGLEGEADANNDRTITNGELHAFINKNVSRQANQTPQLNGDPNQVLVTW